MCAPLISLPTGLMPVSSSSSCCFRSLSVKQHVYSSCFVRATAAVILFVLVMSVQQVSCSVCCSSCSLSFPFLSSCVTFFRTPVVCFALFSVFLFFSSSCSSSYGLACFVVFSHPVLAYHLLYLDELRLFGLGSFLTTLFFSASFLPIWQDFGDLDLPK